MDPEAIKLFADVVLLDRQLQIEPGNPDEDSSDNSLDLVTEESGGSEATPSSSADGIGIQSTSEMNKRCQSVLQEIEQMLLKRLQENKEKQEVILRYLNGFDKKTDGNNESNIGKIIKCAGIPYFKDFHGYPQPRNEDVKEKVAEGKLCCVDYLTAFRTWSKQDKDCLREAVLKDVGEKSGIKSTDLKKLKTPVISDEQMKFQRPIDWLKISATDMNGKYSSSECESQWNLYLSPDVNKEKWSKSETDELNKLAEKYKYQDWDRIATELNTKRTGYQCCIKYQSKNSLNVGKWSTEEDAFLEKLVQKFKRNDKIPWRKVSWFFQTRSRKQCHERYSDHLNKDLKKGFFSPAEDQIIITGVKIFKDFGKLAKFLPGRAPTQIRSRYYYLIGNSMSDFTKEEDNLLMSLAKLDSNNWLKISEHFPNRSKLQCRLRYGVLRKQKGVKQTQKFLPDVDNEEPHIEIEKARLQFNKMLQPDKSKRKGIKSKKGQKSNKEESSAYHEILKYHETCTKNYFGPRLRTPNSEEDLKRLCSYLRATMAMLSVSCDFSEKTDIISSLETNCNFDSFDIKLLRELAEEDKSSDSTLKNSKLLNGWLIPPNYVTLTGAQSLVLNKMRIRTSTCEAEGLPQTWTVGKAYTNPTGSRIAFEKAKALFKSRFMSLFYLPMILRQFPTDNLSQDFFHKGKPKKPKKMSKKRLKEHAREMCLAYKEKKKKLQEQTSSQTQEVNEKDVVEENGHNVMKRKYKNAENESSHDNPPGKAPKRLKK